MPRSRLDIHLSLTEREEFAAEDESVAGTALAVRTGGGLDLLLIGEDMLYLLVGHSHSVVADVEGSRRDRTDLNGTAFGRELDGVTEEVTQHGTDHLPVGLDEESVGMEVNGHVFEQGSALYVRYGVAQYGREVELIDPEAPCLSIELYYLLEVTEER